MHKMTENANVHNDKTQLPEALLNLKYLENVRPRIFILIYDQRKRSSNGICKL